MHYPLRVLTWTWTCERLFTRVTPKMAEQRKSTRLSFPLTRTTRPFACVSILMYADVLCSGKELDLTEINT